MGGSFRTSGYARGAWRAIALVTAMGYPVALQAAGIAYRLDWRVDAGLDCPSNAAFQAAVTRELGRDVFSVDAKSTIRVEVATSERGLVRLSWVDPKNEVLAERNLTGDGADCSALLDGAVLALGVLLNEETAEPGEPTAVAAADAERAAGAAASDVATPSTNVPSPLPPAVADESSTPSPPGSAALTRAGVRISALATGYAGILPHLAFGATFSGAYRWTTGPIVGLELGVVSYSTTRRVVESIETELRLSLLRAAVFVEYPIYRADRWSWTFGALGHVGRLGVDVTGARSVGAAGYVWAAAGARTALRAELGSRVSGLLAVDVLAPLTPREFGVVRGPVLATLAPAAGFVSLGIDMGL